MPTEAEEWSRSTQFESTTTRGAPNQSDCSGLLSYNMLKPEFRAVQSCKSEASCDLFRSLR